MSPQQRFEAMRGRELLRMLTAMPVDILPALYLLVAVQHYHAPWEVKAYLAAIPFVGLLLGPWVLSLAARLNLATSRGVSYLYVAGAIGVLITALKLPLPLFVLGASFAVILSWCTPTLTTMYWRENAPDTVRGSLYGKMFRAGLVSRISLAAAGSWWMGNDPSRYRAICLVVGLLLFVASRAVRHIPASPPEAESRSPVRSLSLVFEDRIFGYVCLVWMILGFSNLLTLPLRTEFIASGVAIVAYPPWKVVVLIDVIPTALRLLTITFWARLFDKIDFFLLRLILNLFIGFGIILFFVPIFWVQLLAASLTGAAFGGGTIMWSLWVTKVASKERTGDYMAAHTFLCGIRGIAAPVAGYLLLTGDNFYEIASVAGVAAFIAALMLVPYAKRSWIVRARRQVATSCSTHS